MPKFAPFVEQSDEDYLFTIDNELHLVWRACQLAWPPVAKVGGAIVNIGPGAGLEGVRTLPQAALAAAKGAVMALTRQLAAEGIAVGIRVNSFSPGVMGTPPVLAMYEEMGANAPVAPVVERTITGKPEIRSRSPTPVCTWRPMRPRGSRGPTSRSTAAPARSCDSRNANGPFLIAGPFCRCRIRRGATNIPL